MNKFITKKGSRLAALAAGIVLFSFTSNAQDLVNSKKVNNVAGGVIRFNNDNGKFTNNNANTAQITNAGTIQMMGTDHSFDGTTPLATATARVPGLVSYADNAVGNQNIFPGYYTDLDMADAATKQFGAGQVFIGGNYTTAGGDRVYGTSLITYDGTGAQAIAAENLTNGGGYNNVDFTNAGLKSLTAGIALVNGTTGIDGSTTGGGVAVNGATAVLTASGDLTQDAGAGDLSVLGDGTVNVNGAANALGANVTVTDGTLALGDGAVASATTVTGTVALADANAIFNANNLSTFNVNGGFTNGDQLRTNMTYDAGSTIDYQDGASNIVTTASTNPYGAFIISKDNGNISPTNNGGTENDINIATSFAMNSVNGGDNLDMLNTTGGMVNLTSGTAGNVTYSSNQEVVGEFRRTHAVVTGVDYKFNNDASIVNFTTAPAGGNYFAMIVNPDGTTAQYDNTRDIKRDINLDYDYTTWVADITAGYQQSDVDEDNLWDGSYNETQIRFREGDATNDEKVSTGNTYTRVASGAGSLGSVKLPGFKPTAAAVDGLADDEFLANNDLILRAGPAIWYSVNPGRWSNPATWDEGTEPPTDAEVVIRHNVWAGFVRPYDGYAIPEATPGAMATKITIQEQNATFPTPTLMIGNDATYPGAFATSTVPVAGITDPGRIIVENVTAPNFLPDYVNEEVTNTNNYIDGLVVFGGAELTASESLINDGCVNVGGTLGIGQ